MNSHGIDLSFPAKTNLARLDLYLIFAPNNRRHPSYAHWPENSLPGCAILVPLISWLSVPAPDFITAQT